MLDQLLTGQTAKEFANSAFTTSLLGALAGAYAGAHGAQLIARRSKLRDDLTAEIRSVNAALAITFSIANSLFALKKQHVKPLLDHHATEEAKLKDFKLKLNSGFIQGNVKHEFQADFRALSTLSLPIAQLVDVVLGKLSTTGRPLNLVIAISGTSETLNGLIARRNALIDDLRGGKLPAGSDLVSMYFGLPYGGGHLNREYPDALSGIGSYLDDLIFYSQLLCKDLREHGESLAQKFTSSFGRPSPRISQVSFDTADAVALMPPEQNYQSLLNAFQSQDHGGRKWWER